MANLSSRASTYTVLRIGQAHPNGKACSNRGDGYTQGSVAQSDLNCLCKGKTRDVDCHCQFAFPRASTARASKATTDTRAPCPGIRLRRHLRAATGHTRELHVFRPLGAEDRLGLPKLIAWVTSTKR